jgi:hypothetical protein
VDDRSEDVLNLQQIDAAGGIPQGRPFALRTMLRSARWHRSGLTAESSERFREALLLRLDPPAEARAAAG